MNVRGWMLLIVSWGCILSLVVFCFTRVFAKKEIK